MQLLPDCKMQGFDISTQGFYLVIHKREKYSLPYICAKRMLADLPSSPIITKRQSSEIFTSLAFENIANATNLRDAVDAMLKYLKDEYHVGREDILELIKKEQDSEQLLVADPHAAQPARTSSVELRRVLPSSGPEQEKPSAGQVPLARIR